ncbi:MAG: 4Fe-4S binding protein [Bryobacteraceae bacterium]
MSVLAVPLQKPRKKLVKRAPRDRSQALRHAVQLVFLALNAWIGLEFYLFVRFCETGGRSMWAARPPGVEGWLPIAALMNWKVFAATGRMPRLHPAGMLLLAAFLAASWMFRKSFCGWLCPVGTVSEALWRLGRRIFGRNLHLPRRLDAGLRSLKYLLLGLFLLAVGSMSVAAIRAFLDGPYGMVDDVKMLNFFRFLGAAGWLFIAALVVASLFVQNFWCRYLCPYGALMGLAALASPLRIRRDCAACIDCGRCAKACPSLLPVDRLVSIRSAECTACLECVAACPAAGALFLSAPTRRSTPAWVVAAGLAILFIGVCGWARLSGHWQTQLPTQVYLELVPHANQFNHP